MTSPKPTTQPYLYQPAFEWAFILMPGFVALLVTAWLPTEYKTTNSMPLAAYVFLVLCADVAHVYSTLFRTYSNKLGFKQHKRLYLAVPLVCYAVGVAAFSWDGLVFWRVLAYAAVFHFVRQQYGFMRLYTRPAEKKGFGALYDSITIYAATLYPLIYWHCSPGRNFNWFVNNDFLIAGPSWLKAAAGVAYAAIVVGYVLKEVYAVAKGHTFNIPKNMVIAGTLLTWYFGIIYFNGDLAFTLLNVIAHGVPYMALVWLWGGRKQPAAQRRNVRSVVAQLVAFVGLIVALAYLEEGLWDGFIWREHTRLFAAFQVLPFIHQQGILCFLVPLLALPQATHYVLDAFIWRKGFEQDGPM